MLKYLPNQYDYKVEDHLSTVAQAHKINLLDEVYDFYRMQLIQQQKHKLNQTSKPIQPMNEQN